MLTLEYLVEKEITKPQTSATYTVTDPGNNWRVGFIELEVRALITSLVYSRQRLIGRSGA